MNIPRDLFRSAQRERERDWTDWTVRTVMALLAMVGIAFLLSAVVFLAAVLHGGLFRHGWPL